jgi:hypothetical protein
VTEVPTDWYANKIESRVDDYWNKVFQMKAANGNVKFTPAEDCHASIKTSLAHGNADPERGLV